ncbi:MAG: M81 family metallopeptidase, partial [Chloroflexi bacterium]|nr:M81 family metallopeptidase [Chloroflexota bacterium]
MERVGVVSIVQETNTFSVASSTLGDFEGQGLYRGAESAVRTRDTNTEFAGAFARLAELGATPVPLLRAWAMSGGRLERAALDSLGRALTTEIAGAGALDALVLSLHGALTADGVDDADAWLLDVARTALGPDVPIGICLDLHANVTAALVAGSTFLVGYQTYPHVDQAQTGARVAELLVRQLRGAIAPWTTMHKRPMLLPAETTQTTGGPMGALRRLADRLAVPPILDISIFPVQPWLDVAELGFAVTVTADGPTDARAIADDIAALAGQMRTAFDTERGPPAEASARARSRRAEGAPTRTPLL